jgi:hypothetical protein
MTEHQEVAVASLLDVLCARGGHVHHGDCVGADAQFHALARERGLRVEIHPPSAPKHRAWLKGDIMWPTYDYLDRNRHIVNCTGILIATPREREEQVRSGTWSTIRKARREHRRIFIVRPDGKILEEN